MDPNKVVNAYERTLLCFVNALCGYFGYEKIAQIDVGDTPRFGGLSYCTERRKILVAQIQARNYRNLEKNNPDARVAANHYSISNIVNSIAKQTRCQGKLDTDFLYTAFCICHELGHYVDLCDQADTNSSNRDNQLKQINDGYEKDISEGISPSRAAARREMAYRKLPEEAFADQFASEHLASFISDYLRAIQDGES